MKATCDLFPFDSTSKSPTYWHRWHRCYTPEGFCQSAIPNFPSGINKSMLVENQLWMDNYMTFSQDQFLKQTLDVLQTENKHNKEKLQQTLLVVLVQWYTGGANQIFSQDAPPAPRRAEVIFFIQIEVCHELHTMFFNLKDSFSVWVCHKTTHPTVLVSFTVTKTL